MKKRQVKSSTREVIADVAVKLFGEHGYTGTTMRDIAEAVGVLPGSLYAHIDSKETLLLEIVSDGIARFLAIEQSLAASASVGSLVVFHQWRFLSEPNRASAIAMRRRYANAYVTIIDDGKAVGEFSPRLDTRIAVFSVLGALNWIPEWYSDKGAQTPGEIAEKMAGALICGLREGSAWTGSREEEAPLPTGRAAAPRKRVAASKGRA
jgi:AcrR family transcriptional regulator